VDFKYTESEADSSTVRIHYLLYKKNYTR